MCTDLSVYSTHTQASLDTLHWNETLGGYFDYGMHSEDGFFDQTVRIYLVYTCTDDIPSFSPRIQSPFKKYMTVPRALR